MPVRKRKSYTDKEKAAAGAITAGSTPDTGKGSTKPKKHRKAITLCEHIYDHYYASGMCKNCYHSKGRLKMAKMCEHTDRTLYARGVCKACYLRNYHSRLRQQQQLENNSCASKLVALGAAPVRDKLACSFLEFGIKMKSQKHKIDFLEVSNQTLQSQ